MNTIDVIIPVYLGYQELRNCLESLCSGRNNMEFQLILINDASPDPSIEKLLSEFEQQHKEVILLKNEENAGFITTVNLGMSLHSDRDVILLNSDTVVANNWIDRLARCAYQSNSIGTVTPFSNNATICSYPEFCAVNSLPDKWSAAELDKLFSSINRGRAVEIPTAVGFCMYIKRACLSDVGLFDSASFGKGYGEETDFCMRASYKNWRHLLCCDTFVYHLGNVSFSSGRENLTMQAEKIMEEKHPDYHTLVRQHIHQDPAREHRKRVLIAQQQMSEKSMKGYLQRWFFRRAIQIQ